jgi:hypothetical protein
MNTKDEIQDIHSFHKLFLQNRTLEILESSHSASCSGRKDDFFIIIIIFKGKKTNFGIKTRKETHPSELVRIDRQLYLPFPDLERVFSLPFIA